MTVTLAGSGRTEMYTRSEWGARPARYTTGFNPSFGSTLHWEGNGLPAFTHAACASYVRGIQNFHMDSKRWSDTAYTAIVCPHGYVFQARWIGNRTGANGTNIGNSSAYAVCYLGGIGNPFTAEADRAFHDVLTHLRLYGKAGPRVNSHFNWKSTQCPGSTIASNAVKYQTNVGSGIVVPGPQFPTGDFLMSLSSAQQKEVYDALQDLRPTLIRLQGTSYADTVHILLRSTYEKIPLRNMDEVNHFKEQFEMTGKVIELPKWKFDMYKTRSR